MLDIVTLHNCLRGETQITKIYSPRGLVDRENLKTREIYESSRRTDELQGQGILQQCFVMETTPLTIHENYSEKIQVNS